MKEVSFQERRRVAGGNGALASAIDNLSNSAYASAGFSAEDEIRGQAAIVSEGEIVFGPFFPGPYPYPFPQSLCR